MSKYSRALLPKGERVITHSEQVREDFCRRMGVYPRQNEAVKFKGLTNVIDGSCEEVQ